MIKEKTPKNALPRTFTVIGNSAQAESFIAYIVSLPFVKIQETSTPFPKPKPINKRLKTKKQLSELPKTTLAENKAKFMQELQQSFREMKEGKTRPIECLINELENAGND